MEGADLEDERLFEHGETHTRRVGLHFVVVLAPDGEDRSVYRAYVPGVPGSVSSIGSPRDALDAVTAALAHMLDSLDDEGRRRLSQEQRQARPVELPPGARIERVLVSAPVREKDDVKVRVSGAGAPVE